MRQTIDGSLNLQFGYAQGGPYFAKDNLNISIDNHVSWNSITFLNLSNPMVIINKKKA